MISSNCGSGYFPRLRCSCCESGSEYFRGLHFGNQPQNYFKNCVKIFWANSLSNIINRMVSHESRCLQTSPEQPMATNDKRRKNLNFRPWEAREFLGGGQDFKHCKNAEIPYLGSLLSGGQKIPGQKLDNNSNFFSEFASLACWWVEWRDQWGPLSSWWKTAPRKRPIKRSEMIPVEESYLQKCFASQGLLAQGSNNNPRVCKPWFPSRGSRLPAEQGFRCLWGKKR